MELLPFRAEYAKSGRASCRACKQTIEKNSLRLAIMVQSPFFDGKQPNWHHFLCFFGRARLKNVAEIAHFESLRWEDQEQIRKKIESGVADGSAGPSSGRSVPKATKRKAEEYGVPDIADYIVEYAKTGKSKCKVCEGFIPKKNPRISKKDYEGEAALQYGPTERWHHVDCFLKAREELGFWGPADILPGFMTLSPEDQKELKEKILEMKPNKSELDPSPVKKPKEDKSEQKIMKKQNDLMYKHRDNLQALHKTQLTHLLEYNKQQVPEGVPRILDRLSDIMSFGALSPCSKCNGQFVFTSGIGYVCTGYLSEWAKCEARTSDPKRVIFKMPADMKKEHPFCKEYKGKVSKRVFDATLGAERGTIINSIKSEAPLTCMEFFIHKTKSKSAEDIRKQIEKLGGTVADKFSSNIAAVISIESELRRTKPLKIIKSAADNDIHVLPEDVFDGVTLSTSRGDLAKKLNDSKISEWGSDISSKIMSLPVKKSMYPSKSVYPSKSTLFKSDKSVAKVTLKGGLAVDPDSKIEKIAHVYQNGDDIYSVVLSLTDVAQGKNSFYKMQVLESDKLNKYWFFRSWGRIGTTIGGTKCEQLSSLNECLQSFKEHFEEKTGNFWEQKKSFVKRPGKMMMLDVTYGDQTDAPQIVTSADKEQSSLAKPIQDLITLIFDVERMKKTMLEFELDLNKMPLGKLSQKQIHEAFSILTELQNFNTITDQTLIISRTNQFYTLVPHDLGRENPPLLDNEVIIKQKIDMLNNLMDIEIAYNLLQEAGKGENPIDSHYSKLNTAITVLDTESDEFKYIRLYIKNTHAKTHSNYSLDIEQVFKIERKGEASKFKKYNKLSNKKLLWHGSRTTNFAGILSQGLRIAPPEAPPSGYMFGKGVYFADMVSKSANYCMTSKKNATGLILLCEVALGQMHELTWAEYVEKLPPGKHSVKGLGQTHPDPSEVVIMPNGTEIPLGKGVDSDVKDTSLLYNEYIVYDTAQVKIQYLVRLKFNYRV